jgi:polar amino acid transport system substrate-binding protein
MTTRRVVCAALVLVTALVAGCGSSADPNAGPAPFAPPRPVGVEDPAVIPTNSAGPAPACDALASFRPSGSPPAPGAMPAGSTMDRIAARGRLVVGINQNTYLFGYRDAATGEIVGFDVDIAREVAAAIFGDWRGHIQLVATTSAQRIPFLRDKTVDIVANTMTINCDRWRQVNFSSQYYQAGQRLLVPRTSKARGIDDMGGKKVCAASGSTSIQNIAAAKSKPVPVSVADWTDCLVLLQQGQVDGISTDDTILAGLLVQDPTTKMVGPTFTSEPYGLAIAKGSEDFVRFVNGVLERIRADGTWAAIYRRWLGSDVPAPPVARYRD